MFDCVSEPNTRCTRRSIAPSSNGRFTSTATPAANSAASSPASSPRRPRSAVLAVANERTRLALPSGVRIGSVESISLDPVKLDAQVIDTVSFGLFLARLHKGTRIMVETMRVNDEVWLPKHMTAKVDVRVALLKNFNVDADVTYRDYKKFRTGSKIVGIGEVVEPQAVESH